MNEFLQAPYVEHIERLAAGLEPVDALRRSRIGPPVCVLRDAPLTEAEIVALRDRRGDVAEVLPRFESHGSRRHVLRYAPGVFRAAVPYVDVRLVEGPRRVGPRRFVPRRLRIPLVSPESADGRSPGFRIRHPALYPGAAYDVHETATGVRGRVERGGVALRWVRVEARDGAGVLVGRAHGDDRGEFLLILGSEGNGMGEPRREIDVRVEVFGPASPPPAASALVRATDPLWDLPLEALPDTDVPDPVTRGEQHPWADQVSTIRMLTLRLGRITSERDPFVIP